MHTVIALTTVDLARMQFAMTSLYHFLFVPLTLGLAPIVAMMQTAWDRTGNDEWLRLTRFFGTLLLINFAIGAATGIVQEFQFGMDWSTYSTFVGNVFGAPLAIEGLAAFFLESVFLGAWIFGWKVLPKGVHLMTIWLAALGTWLSACFILIANSWMQHPVGSTVENGQAKLTDVWALMTSGFALHAILHTLLVGLTTASIFVFGIACWHLLRGRNVEVFKRAAALALVIAVPLSGLNLIVGSRFGITVTTDQPMKIAAAEALWNTEQPASFSLFQIGGFSQSDQTPSVDIEVPKLLSFLSTGSWNSKVDGLNQLQAQDEAKYGPGNYIPNVFASYWGMRVMAYLGTLVFFVALLGAWLYRRGKLESTRWFLRVGIVTIFFPFIAALAGWVLAEVGRQPWIVQGLLKTDSANSPAVSSAMIATSFTVLVLLYGLLAVLDIVLMRRYARIDPPVPDDAPGTDVPDSRAALNY